MGLTFKSVPVGSIQLIPADERESYFAAVLILPKVIQELLFSTKTGAYVRGLAKTYNLPDDSTPLIALTILKITLGKITLPQLGAVLSSQLRIANDVAQKMATELEHDLFSAVAGDLNTYLEEQKSKKAASAAVAASKAGASNVLDLKDTQPKPKPPLPLTPRPPRPPVPPMRRDL